MRPREMRPGVYWVGYTDWDRRLFDALIPLPDGTSYNAYLVRGSQKTALIETVDSSFSQYLLDGLDCLHVQELDYIIANHAEQDHSGALPAVLKKYPAAKVICTSRCKTMLADLLLIPEDRVTSVNDGDTLSLGDRTLEFIHAPWVHWPETMLTLLREDHVLFPCDFLGSHLATSDVYVTDEGQVYEAAKRYYAEIMMPFRTNIQKHLERLKGYRIDLIAPGHGPAYADPSVILKAYGAWAFDPPRNAVVLPYVSMHGSTRRMVEYLVAALSSEGVAVRQFDLTVTDIGKLAMALVDAATLVIATPTTLAGPHPLVAQAAYLANALRPKTRFAAIIGSFGWGGKAVEQLAAMMSNLKVETFEPIMVRGVPKEAEFKALDNLAALIARKHKENGFT